MRVDQNDKLKPTKTKKKEERKDLKQSDLCFDEVVILC